MLENKNLSICVQDIIFYLVDDDGNEIENKNKSTKLFRLKDNISVIKSPLEKISKISGVSFNWNDKQSAYEAGKKDYGVIAQEVEEVLPELVTTRENGYKAVRYEKIVSLLIEATKAQQTQIEDLRNQVNELTQKLNNS